MAPLDFLRNVVGPEPTNDQLLELLSQHSGNVERAANSFFTNLGVPARTPPAPASGGGLYPTPLAPASGGGLSSQDLGTRTYRFEAGPVGLALANSSQLGGIVVSDVISGSQAERIGVPLLSVITHVDGQSLGSCAAQDLVQIFRQRGERPMLLRVRHPPAQQQQPPPLAPPPAQAAFTPQPSRDFARTASIPASPALGREPSASFSTGQRVGLLSPQSLGSDGLPGPSSGGGSSPPQERSRSFFMRRRSSSSSNKPAATGGATPAAAASASASASATLGTFFYDPAKLPAAWQRIFAAAGVSLSDLNEPEVGATWQCRRRGESNPAATAALALLCSLLKRRVLKSRLTERARYHRGARRDDDRRPAHR